MPGVAYSGIGLAHRIEKCASIIKSGSDGTASTLAIGGLSAMNDEFKGGNVAKSCDKCHTSNDAVAFDRIRPVICEGLYLYSAYLSW